MNQALVLVAHGTVDSIDDLPEFLNNIRRGNPVSADLLAEVRRRYEAIGGKSPLNQISREVADRLEKRLAVPVRLALRLWKPYPRDVFLELAKSGFMRLGLIALAQHSSSVYAEAAQRAAWELKASQGIALELSCAPNWGGEPLLTKAYAQALREAIQAIPKEECALTTVVMTAHSLPLSVVEAGDPYADEVKRSAEAVARAFGDSLPIWTLAFQSQGIGPGPDGRPVEWLGPGLESTFDRIVASGHKRVLIAPIGFLADHVEILYDIDIEATRWAADRGLALTRTASLNASDLLLDTLERLAQPLLSTAIREPIRNV